METAPFVWTRLLRSRDASAPVIHRAGSLTPYLAEMIVDDVRRGGPDVRLEVMVAAELEPAGVDLVRERLARLAGMNVVFTHRRQGHAGAMRPGAAA